MNVGVNVASFPVTDGGATREQQIVQSVYATDFTVSITCSVGHTQPRNVPNFLINLVSPLPHALLVSPACHPAWLFHRSTQASMS